MDEEELVPHEMFDPVDLLDRGMDLREGEEEDGEVDLQQAVSEEERADTVDLLVKVEDPTADSELQEVALLTVEEEEDLPLGTKPIDDSQTQVFLSASLLATFPTSVPPFSTTILSLLTCTSPRLATLSTRFSLLPFQVSRFSTCLFGISSVLSHQQKLFYPKTTHPRINPLP